MVHEWLGDNKSAIAILRKSSDEQSSISHETQEAEIRTYCQQHGLNLKPENIFRIVESAKDSDHRRKYNEAIDSALNKNLRHVLFYMYDREARNLTDAEKNAKLVKADLLCLHYVREQKVLHQGSPGSDFFMRNIHAVMNTQFIDNLRVKVVDAMKQKAETGWWPSNNVPLGYATRKIRDEKGKELKRGTTVARDPDEKRVRWAQREFELRAKGLSFREVRQGIIDEGLIPLDHIKKYRIGAIEQRLKNPFYMGRFIWRGIEYQGKHELIIPPAIFAAAQRAGRGFHRRVFDAEHGVFAGGWLRCAECGCHIIYDPKKKVARTTGKVTIFHYYHCSNGRMMHASQAGLNVNETVIWEQLESAVDAISITPKLATEVANVLNENQKKSASSSARKIADLKDAIKQLEAKEDQAYDNMTCGNIDTEAYRRQVGRFREERKELNSAIQTIQSDMNGAFRETALTTLELCKEAKQLYKTRSTAERADFIKRLVSNPRLNGVNVEFDLKKPFGVLAKITKNENWCALVEEFRTSCIDFHGGKTHENQAHL
jgi:site-specific DNA recombinase